LLTVPAAALGGSGGLGSPDAWDIESDRLAQAEMRRKTGTPLPPPPPGPPPSRGGGGGGGGSAAGGGRGASVDANASMWD